MDDTGAENVTFEYRDAGTSDSFEEISVEEADSSEVTYTNWNLADPGSGEYELRGIEQDSEGNFLENATIEITIDNSGPSLEDESPTSVIDDDNPDIDATFEDDVSGLENASITFEGEESETLDIGGDSSVDLTIDSGDYDSLDDGSHSVDYEAYDQAGNQLEGSWSFTVDTTNPDPDGFDLDPSEGLHDVSFGDDFTIEVSFEATEDHESEVTATCFVNGEDEDSSSWSNLGDGDDESFECDIPDDYFDQTVDFEVELEDEAGNTWSSDTYFYELDASTPVVEIFEPLINVSVYNDDFDMEYLASDAVAGVDSVEYYVNSDPGLGDGNQFANESGEITVDTSDLGEGSHEVFLRAQDNLEKWGSSESFEFEFLPDAEPELSLETAESLEVVSGEEETLNVDITNTGQILVSEGEVTGSEDYIEAGSYGELAPGDEDTATVAFSPENDLGESNVTLEASTSDASVEVEVLVRASESQQEDIDGEIGQYEADLDDLSSRIEELRGSLSDERASRIESDFENFESQLNDAEQSIEEGRYYEASEILENLGESRDSAESTFETVKEEHETAMRNRYILAGIFFVLLLVGGGAGFVLYSEEYEIDVDSLSDLSIGVGEENSDEESDSGYSGQEEESDEDSESAIDRIKNRVDDLRSGEESDEPEYEFK